MATSGLYGNSSESIGLYGNTNVFGGTYFQWFIFQENNGQPVTPTGGSWDFTTNVGTPPTGWTTTVASVPTTPVWFSTAFIDSRNPTVFVWSAPSLLTSSNSIYASTYAETFTGDGTQTVFTLTNSPVTVNNTDVSINGVVQVPGVDYTINAVTLTTTTAVPNRSVMLVKYRQSLPNSYYGLASNVGFTPVGTLTSTNVQSAIAEVVTDLALSSGSSTVGYLPAGTGAVATTVQTKLRETVSVFDYLTAAQITDVQARTLSLDLTTPVQAAITYCSTNKLSLYFPEGSYSVGGIAVPSTGNMTIFGAGMFNSILVNRQTTGLSFFYVQGSNVEIHSLQIDGNYSAQSANTGTALILALNPTTGKAQNISVHDCLVKAAGFDAIGAFNVIRSKITNNIVYGYFDSGIDIVDGCTDILVEGNSIINTGKYGIYVETGNNVTYNNNNNIVITGNTITQLAAPSSIGIGIGIGTHTDNIQVSNNAISLEYAGTFGIKAIITGESISISGNVVRGNTGAPASTTGIYVENISDYAAKNTTIIGNSTYTLATGIYVYKISNVTVVGNVSNSTAAYICDGGGVTISNVVSNNVFNGTVSFVGYSGTANGYFSNNIGTFTFTVNTSWVISYLGVRNTVSYNDGIIYYVNGIKKYGTTAQRPASSLQGGDMYFDTTLTRPIWWTGSAWIKADGTSA